MRLTTVIAVATGYYFGAKGGERRYNQILWVARTIANSQALQNLLNRLSESLRSAAEAVSGGGSQSSSRSGQGQQSSG